MAGDTEDTIGCLIGMAVLIVGAGWLYNNYEIRKRVPEAPPPIITPMAKPVANRPTGMVELSTTKSGARWLLDADSVSGPRTARQGWVTIDYSKDKTVAFRTTRELYLVDCGTTATRILSTARYDSSGVAVSSESHEPKDAKIDYYPPITLGGTIVRRVCSSDFDGK